MKKQNQLSLGKQVLFSLIIVLVFFLFLEALLRLAGVDQTDRLLNLSGGFSPQETHFTVFPDGAGSGIVKTKKMPQALFGRELLNPAEFPLRPAPEVYRIILFGGSTTYGWPLDDRFSYAAWLRAGLPETADGRRIEILNFGVPGYGSRRILNLVRESLRFEPDLIILLTGHNEILEAGFSETILKMPEPLVAVHTLLLARSRLYGSLNYLALRLRWMLSPTDGHPPPPLPRAYSANRAFLVEEEFRHNLGRIAALSREASVSLILCTVPANIGDMPPNGDFPPSSWETAPSDIPDLLEKRPADACLRYRYGRYLYEAGKFEEAREHLQKACDFDPIALRVTSRLNRVVRETAGEEGVLLLDLLGVFERNATGGIPGSELFFDNCHPTVESHRMISRAIAGFLVELGVIAGPPGWEVDFLEKVEEAFASRPLTDLDLYRYWQNMASFYSLHGAREEYRESREQMLLLEERIRP